MSLAYSNALIAIFFFFLVLLQDVRALLAATVDGLDLDLKVCPRALVAEKSPRSEPCYGGVCVVENRVARLPVSLITYSHYG